MANDLDWKKLVSTIAPTLGTLLGGPLAGTAISALSNVFLGNPDGNESEVSAAVLAGLTPDKIVEMKKIDLEHQETMAKLGFDFEKLNQETELAYVSDTADARKYKDNNVFWLGVVILSLFGVVMGMSLYGTYGVITGGIPIKDVSVVAAISGFVGTIIGYVASNAQQVVSYFYGSSAGSVRKTDAMSQSFKEALTSKK